jgi:putative transposase
LNPVRADMVQAPGEYRWSSYRANALAEEDPLVSPHQEYLSLGSTSTERSEAYRVLLI